MTGVTQTAADASARLERVSQAPEVPARVQRSAAALAERLRAPVRIGVTGLPGAGQCDVLCGLIGVDFAALPDLPPVEMAHGTAPRVEAMLGDGALVAHTGPLTDGILAQSPVFLRLSLPEPALQGRQVLLVTAPPTELPAALAWAAERVDICLWCATAWSATDEAIWQGAPDRLTHHAVLVSGGGAGDGFDAVFAPQDLPALTAHLDQIVEEAAAQDLLAADVILQQHCLPEPTLPKPEPTPPEARMELERLFQSLRGGAETLRNDLAHDHADAVPEAVEHLLGQLSDKAERMDRMAETWPGVPDLLFEARDLALLMQIEDGPAQAVEAARLLTQVRREMEVLLAA